MWRASYSLFGLTYTSADVHSLQDCLDAIKREWRDHGFDNMAWFRIEEFFEGKWHQRGFIKMDE